MEVSVRYVTTMAVAIGMMLGMAVTMHGEAEKVTGELVTVMCFVKNGDKGRGDDHAACALKCAKEGYPLALVTADGKMYKLTGPLTKDKNVGLQNLLAKTVVATGDIHEEGEGKTLEITSVVPAKP